MAQRYTTRNLLSDKALKALESGTYDQLTGRDPKYRTSQEQLSQGRELPVLKGMGTSFGAKNAADLNLGSGASSFDPIRARRNYEMRIGHNAPDFRNLRNQGYDGSYNDFDFSDYDKYSENNWTLTPPPDDLSLDLDYNQWKEKQAHNEKTKDWAPDSIGAKIDYFLREGYKGDKLRAEEAEAERIKRQKYIDKYGAPMEEVLKAYERHLEDKKRQEREEHPYTSGLKDFWSAPDRALANAAGIAAREFFPNSDLDKMANSDLVQSKVKEVNKNRNYTYNSNKLSNTQKGIAKFVNEGGDLAADTIAAMLTGNPLAMADTASGFGLVAEIAPWISETLNAAIGYGEMAGSTKNDLLNRGVDEDTANSFANVMGLAGAAGRAAQRLKGATAVGESMLENLWNSAKFAGKLGAGKQTVREIADAVILEDQGNIQTDIKNYTAKGMSEAEAIARAVLNSFGRVGESTLIEALAGAGYGFLSSVGNKGAGKVNDGLNSVWATQDALPQNNIPLLTGESAPTQAIPGAKLPALVDNIYPIQMPGTTGVIPMPGTNGVISDLPAPIMPVDPSNVIYHSGILSKLNKADTAGKMPGMRDTGYYGTGHYFVDQAHKKNIGPGSGYGDKPYTSVDISKYENLYPANTDKKASDLHDFSQRMMRYVNGRNDYKFTNKGELDQLAKDSYLTDLYGQYLELFQNDHMSYPEFVNRLDEFRNNYNYDWEDRGDTAFTTFMKEHGYNGVDTRGTNSANTERGIVIYDLDEDSILQSNVTDQAVKDGLMNTKVRNGQPLFDAATDERITGQIRDREKRNEIMAEYRRSFDVEGLEKLESDISATEKQIQHLEEDIIPYEQLKADRNEELFELEYKEFRRADPDFTREQFAEIFYNNDLEDGDPLVNAKKEVKQLKASLKKQKALYKSQEDKAHDAYLKARDTVERKYAAEKARPTSIFSKPVKPSELKTQGPATFESEQSKIDKFLDNKKPGSIELESGRVFEHYSQKDMKNVLQEIKDAGVCDEDFQVAIVYNNGDYVVYGGGDDTSNMKLTGIKTAIWDNDATTAYSGNGVNIINYDDSAADPVNADWRLVFEEDYPRSENKVSSPQLPVLNQLEIEDTDFAKGVANATPDNSFSRMNALLNQVTNKAPTVQPQTPATSAPQAVIPSLNNGTTYPDGRKFVDPVDRALADPNVVNTHTPEELAVMRDYVNSTDEKLLQYISDSRNKPYVKPYELKKITGKMAEDLKAATGLSTSKRLTLDQSIIRDHAIPRHGADGAADKSLADDNTLARIQYVMDNYDEVYKGQGNTYLRMNDKSPAPTAVFTKKVDDHYVVAVVSSDKTDVAKVVSVYVANENGIKDDIQKGKLTQLSHDAEGTLPRTPEANSLSLSSNNTVDQSAENVNSEAEGYWLRVLGDDEFAVQESQKNGMSVEDYRGIAASNVPGAEVPPPSNVPPTNNVPPTDNPNNGENMRERGMSRHARGEGKMRLDIPEEVRDDFINDPDMYEQLSNKSTSDRALKIYNEHPDDRESIFRSMLTQYDPAALPLGNMIAKDYSAQGNHAMAAQIIRDMGERLTKAGQFSQASIISMLKNDPLTAQQYAQRSIDKLNKQGQKEFGKKWKLLALTKEEIDTFNEIKPGDEKALAELYDKIGQRLGKEYPSTVMERLLEGRKVAMLFNLRTISRNFFANPPTLGMRYLADRVEAIGQNIVHLIDPTFEKTQSLRSGGTGRKLAKDFTKTERYQKLVNGVDEKHMVPDLKSEIIHHKQMYKGTAVEKFIDTWVGNAFNSMSDALYEAGKISTNPHIKGGIQALNSKLYNKEDVQSILESIRNTTYKLLDITDSPFVKENFVERLGSYLNAQGIKSLEDIPEDAIQVAWNEALKATYKDDSWMVKALKGIKGGIEKIPVVGKPLSQGLIPFLQAPGNIGARIVDYSPVKFTKGVAQIIKGAAKKDHETIRKGIEAAAKGLTGSGLALLGMKLYKSGILTGDYSSDDKEKSFQQRNGFKPWSLHVADKYFSFNWMQPFAQTIMSGILIQQALDNADAFDSDVLRHFGIEGSAAGRAIGAAYESGKAAINSWFDETPLGDLTKLFEGSYYDRDIAQNMVDVGGDFAGAMYPATGNALAKTVDTTKRSTKDPSNAFSTFLNEQKAKIPFVSETLPAAYDTWGEEIKNADSKGEAFFQRFVFPGEYSSDSSDPLDVEIQRLFKETSDNRAFPFYAANKVGDKTLNNREKSEYQKDMGQRSKQFAQAFINSDRYKSMDDANRVETLNSLYYTSKAITERDVFGKPVADSSQYKKLIQAYDEAGGGEKGIQAVVNYSETKAQMKAAGITSSSKLGKEVLEASQKGDTKTVEKITETAKTFEDMGFTKVNPKETYVKAKEVDSSITPESFATTYREIDGADGSQPNEGIKMDEVLAYANKNHLNEQQMNKTWSMYAPAGKQVPYLKKDGTWGKHSPKK